MARGSKGMRPVFLLTMVLLKNFTNVSGLKPKKLLYAHRESLSEIKYQYDNYKVSLLEFHSNFKNIICSSFKTLKQC
jgi:hypothetical protein